jgi:hypothetical protein
MPKRASVATAVYVATAGFLFILAFSAFSLPSANPNSVQIKASAHAQIAREAAARRLARRKGTSAATLKGNAS